MKPYEPKPGDYGVVSTTGLIGYLIQLGTRSRDNHAFVYVGQGYILEATPKRGVVLSPVTNYKDIVWNRHEELTDAQRKIIVDTADSRIGSPYFFKSFIVIGFRILGINLPKFLTGDLSKDKGLICSELVSVCYRAAGIVMDNTKPDYFVTPADLAFRLLYQ